MDTKPNHNIILNHHCTESWAFIWNNILIFSQVFEEGTMYDQQTGRITLSSTPDQLLEKPQVCTSSLQMHAAIHHVHSHTITHTHTQPQRHSTHLVTNLDNTRHLRLRTQIPQKLTKLFLHFYSTKYHTQQPLYNTLELLMMGIVMPETCWASNKICNKNLCCI